MFLLFNCMIFVLFPGVIVTYFLLLWHDPICAESAVKHQPTN